MLPLNTLNTPLRLPALLSPDNTKRTNKKVDYELGPFTIGDTAKGLLNQTWRGWVETSGYTDVFDHTNYSFDRFVTSIDNVKDIVYFDSVDNENFIRTGSGQYWSTLTPGSYLTDNYLKSGKLIQILKTETFSIETEFKISDMSNDYSSIFGTDYPTLVAGALFLMVLGTDKGSKISFGTFNQNPILTSTTLIEVDTLYKVRIEGENGQVSLYLNDILETTGILNEDFWSNNGFFIGKNGWDGAKSTFNGLIKYLKIVHNETTFCDFKVESCSGVLIAPINDLSNKTLLVKDKGITEISFTFDQVGRPQLAYMAENLLKFWWFNTLTSSQDITEYPGLKSPSITLDDKRSRSASTSDVLFFYLKNTSNNVFCRVQRDRYQVEYDLGPFPDTTISIDNVGFTTGNRIGVSFKTAKEII